MEKKTSVDTTIAQERAQLKEQIDNLNGMLLTMKKVPMSVLETIGNLEEKLQELDQQFKQQSDMVLAEQSVDFNLLSEIKDPIELNMMLKRVIKEITVFNLKNLGE